MHKNRHLVTRGLSIQFANSLHVICGFDIMLERHVLLVSRLLSVFLLGHQQPGRLSSLDFLAQLKVYHQYFIS